MLNTVAEGDDFVLNGALLPNRHQSCVIEADSRLCAMGRVSLYRAKNLDSSASLGRESLYPAEVSGPVGSS
jgi:hypothetical protein